MVCCDRELVPELLKRLSFLPDPHMTAIVGKETGWRNHQNLMLHSGYSTAVQQVMQLLGLDTIPSRRYSNIMAKRATSETTRRQILHAAAHVIQTQGTEALTLEAVALAAGVSKGGLLYHFPGKSALIGGMIEHVLAAFDAALAEEEAREQGPQAGSWLRAYLRATFTPAGQQLELTSGLLAAVAADPTLLAPLQARYAIWQHRAETDGLDPAKATVVRLALDGLWIADLLRFAPPHDQLREDVRNMLLALATE